MISENEQICGTDRERKLDTMLRSLAEELNGLHDVECACGSCKRVRRWLKSIEKVLK